jgi:GT2 family glycosyltransferase
VKPPRCSVVIPNLNGERLLRTCLACLERQTVELELVLVDNGSTDGSVAMAREHFPDASVLELGENRGFAAAVNAGVRASSRELVAFLNNDTEPESDWLEELIACLDRHPRAAAATSKTLLASDRRIVDGAGDWMDWRFRPYPRAHGRRDSDRLATEVQVFGAAGAAAVWRRNVLEEIGLFDEDFFAFYEDVDLSLRARLAGYECWYAPRSVALHHRGATAAGRHEFAFFLPFRNRWFVIVKNVPGALLVRRGHRILVGEAHWWLQALRNRHARRLLRAYGEVVQRWPRLREKRRQVQALRRVPMRELDQALRRRYDASR